MENRDIIRAFLLLSPVIVAAIRQSEIIKHTLPDAGDQNGAAYIPYYRNVLDISQMQKIRFSVKAANDATLLFSERHANTIDYYSDFDYNQVLLGGWDNSLSGIRQGDMWEGTGLISTPGILDNTMYKYFWASWDSGVFR